MRSTCPRPSIEATKENPQRANLTWAASWRADTPETPTRPGRRRGAVSPSSRSYLWTAATWTRADTSGRPRTAARVSLAALTRAGRTLRSAWSASSRPGLCAPSATRAALIDSSESSTTGLAPPRGALERPSPTGGDRRFGSEGVPRPRLLFPRHRLVADSRPRLLELFLRVCKLQRKPMLKWRWLEFSPEPVTGLPRSKWLNLKSHTVLLLDLRGYHQNGVSSTLSYWVC